MKTIRPALRILFLVLMGGSMPVMAQSGWVKVANEGDTVAASILVTVRYGSGTLWTVPQVMSGTFSVSNSTFGDPAPNTVKELDVQETSVAQTVLVNGAPVTVPALATVPVAGTVTTPTPSTVTTKDQVITTTAPVIPVGTTLCTVPKTGGQCKTTVPITLAPLTATVPGQTAPVTSVPGKLLVTCPNMSALPNGQPDWTQPFTCTAVPQ